jgi:hypothetical protein
MSIATSKSVSAASTTPLVVPEPRLEAISVAPSPKSARNAPNIAQAPETHLVPQNVAVAGLRQESIKIQPETKSAKKSRGQFKSEQAHKTATLAAVELVHDATPEYWVPRINSRLIKTVEAIVGAGKELALAKSKLPHGQWGKLFETGQLHIDKRSAQMFMAIARNQILADAHNYAYLPPMLNPLNVLSGLDEKRLQQALDAGKVSPSMTIKSAKSLAAELQSGKQKPPPAKSTQNGDVASPGNGSAQPSDPQLPASLAIYFAEFLSQTKRIMSAYPNHALAVRIHAELTLRKLREFREGSASSANAATTCKSVPMG